MISSLVKPTFQRFWKGLDGAQNRFSEAEDQLWREKVENGGWR